MEGRDTRAGPVFGLVRKGMGEEAAFAALLDIATTVAGLKPAFPDSDLEAAGSCFIRSMGNQLPIHLYRSGTAPESQGSVAGSKSTGCLEIR